MVGRCSSFVARNTKNEPRVTKHEIMKKKRIKKNDIVYIKTGKDKGKVGKILQVFYKNDKFCIHSIKLSEYLP